MQPSAPIAAKKAPATPKRKKMAKVTKPMTPPKPNKTIRYFSVSSVKLFMLSFFTFGLYDAYWFYRNWKAVRGDSKEFLSPFWRAIFSIFTVHLLFKKIARTITGKPYAKRYHPASMATLYILAAVAEYILLKVIENAGVSDHVRLILGAAIVLTTVGRALSMVATQQAVNRYLADTRYAGRSTTGLGFTVLALVGIVYFGLVMTGLFAPNSTFGSKPARHDTPAYQNLQASTNNTPATATTPAPRTAAETTPVKDGPYNGWTRYHNNDQGFAINAPSAVKISDYAAASPSDPAYASFLMDLYSDSSGRTIEFLHIAVYNADLQTSAKAQDVLRTDIYQVAPTKKDVTVAGHKAILYYYDSDIRAAIYLIDDGARTFAISGFVHTKDPSSVANYWNGFSNTVDSFAIDN